MMCTFLISLNIVRIIADEIQVAFNEIVITEHISSVIKKNSILRKTVYLTDELDEVHNPSRNLQVGVSEFAQLHADIFAEHNKYRVTMGLPVFKWSRALSMAARDHTTLMTQNNISDHNVAGTTPGSRTQKYGRGGCAENLSRGHETGKGVTQQLIDSPGHQRQMVGNYREFGVYCGRTKGTQWGDLVNCSHLMGNFEPNPEYANRPNERPGIPLDGPGIPLDNPIAPIASSTPSTLITTTVSSAPSDPSLPTNPGGITSVDDTQPVESPTLGSLNNLNSNHLNATNCSLNFSHVYNQLLIHLIL